MCHSEVKMVYFYFPKIYFQMIFSNKVFKNMSALARHIALHSWWPREQHTECSGFKFFHFLKEILCLQKVITYHWICWRKINWLGYRNFRNITWMRSYGNKNLRIYFCFYLYKCSMRCSRWQLRIVGFKIQLFSASTFYKQFHIEVKAKLLK